MWRLAATELKPLYLLGHTELQTVVAVALQFLLSNTRIEEPDEQSHES